MLALLPVRASPHILELKPFYCIFQQHPHPIPLLVAPFPNPLLHPSSHLCARARVLSLSAQQPEDSPALLLVISRAILPQPFLPFLSPTPCPPHPSLRPSPPNCPRRPILDFYNLVSLQGISSLVLFWHLHTSKCSSKINHPPRPKLSWLGVGFCTSCPHVSSLSSPSSNPSETRA